MSVTKSRIGLGVPMSIYHFLYVPKESLGDHPPL